MLLNTLFIKTYWTKLMLFLAIDIACFTQVGFEFIYIFIEIVTK